MASLKLSTTFLLLFFQHSAAGLNVTNLTQSLILASSPFLSDSQWRPSHHQPLKISIGDDKSEEVKQAMIETMKEDTDIQAKIEGSDSKIHEVRVAAPFSVTKTVDRSGKSLYSPGHPPVSARYFWKLIKREEV